MARVLECMNHVSLRRLVPAGKSVPGALPGFFLDHDKRQAL